MIALCLATTVLIKMQKTRYILVTILPMVFMTVVTFSAGFLKVFSPDPKLGFLSGAQTLIASAADMTDPNKASALVRQAAVWRSDAAVAGCFLLLVLLIITGSAVQWWQMIRGAKPVVLKESEFVPLGSAEAV